MNQLLAIVAILSMLLGGFLATNGKGNPKRDCLSDNPPPHCPVPEGPPPCPSCPDSDQ